MTENSLQYSKCLSYKEYGWEYDLHVNISDYSPMDKNDVPELEKAIVAILLWLKDNIPIKWYKEQRLIPCGEFEVFNYIDEEYVPGREIRTYHITNIRQPNIIDYISVVHCRNYTAHKHLCILNAQMSSDILLSLLRAWKNIKDAVKNAIGTRDPRRIETLISEEAKKILDKMDGKEDKQ